MSIDEMQYLRIDEKENAIDSLSRSLLFLKETKKDPFAWKWFIIAVHHTVHSFMLLALQNSDASGVWSNTPTRDSDNQIKVFDEKNDVVSFMRTFARIQRKDLMGGYIDAKAFTAQQYHKDSMEHLNNRLRNQFIHYRPHSWSISYQYFVDIVEPILEIITFLTFNSGRCRFEQDQLNQIQRYLDEIETLLKKSSDF